MKTLFRLISIALAKSIELCTTRWRIHQHTFAELSCSKNPLVGFRFIVEASRMQRKKKGMALIERATEGFG